MRWDDPNRPDRATDLRPVERFTEGPETGNAARDGYTVSSRRPRHGRPGEMVPVERAERIDEVFSSLPDMDSY